LTGLRRLGQVFDQVAEAYDDVRPGYPASLVARAVERGGLARGARVVEVGAGTGKLTELLVEHGLAVDAVEPGENMIAAARRRLGDARVRFHAARFEDVELPESSFGGLFSATAFHWVDPAVGWARAASLLRPRGLLALLVNTRVHDEASAELEAELHAVVERHAPEATAGWRSPPAYDELLAGARERSANVSEAWDWLMGDRHGLARPEAAGLFGDVEVDGVLVHQERTADELIATVRTTSLWFQVPVERRAAFEADGRRAVERFGGTSRSPLATVLVTARRSS
jgi:ubiquinone/menaquinone biosynthesis C-methylase UbiE